MPSTEVGGAASRLIWARRSSISPCAASSVRASSAACAAPAIAIGHRDLQIGPQLFELVIYLRAVVSAADDIERGSHRKQITIVD